MIYRLFLIGLIAAWPVGVIAKDHPMHGVALVIGESKYEQLPVLTNPGKDARDIDRLLGDLGFDVTRVLNADGDKMREAIAQFEDDAKDADVALIYYSGHGIEAKGANFIAPTDTDISTPEAAGTSMIAVQPILDELAKTTPVSIVLLDACRSDPFPAGQMIVLPGDTAPTPVEGQGLAPVRGPTPVALKTGNPDDFGSVIGFSASPGEPALDGPAGENSPYAAALLKHFAAGGYSFGDVMTMVSEEVYLKTKTKQLPWTNSSLRRVLTFDAPAEDDADADQTAIKSERRKLLLSIATTPQPTQKYVESLAGQEQVPLDQLYGMLNALGVKTNDGGGDLQQELAQGATRLKELLAQKDDSVKADPELERLSKLADDAEGEGAIALALKYRDQASGRADTLLQGKQAEAEKLRQDMIDIADTYAANAATALLNFDQLHAADLYAKAFDAVKDWDKAKALKFKIAQGDALTSRGFYHLDNEALAAAFDVYGQAIERAPRSTDPVTWARVERQLGVAQETLGARLTDDAMLRRSVDSLRAALTVQSETLTPGEWAATQNSLGNTLYALGARASDLDLMYQGVDALNAALRVTTRTSDPLSWQQLQTSKSSFQVGIADLIYASTSAAEMDADHAGNVDPTNIPVVKGARDRAVTMLTDAVSSLSTLLQANGVTSGSDAWVSTQLGLASALSTRAKITGFADDLAKAADAFREVMTVETQEKTPTLWSNTASNLAVTLRHYAKLTKQAGPLRDAAGMLTEVLKLTPRADSPVEWADVETKLGNIFSDLAEYDEPAYYEAGIAAYESAGEVITADRDIQAWNDLQVDICSALFRQAAATLDPSKLAQSRVVALAAQAKMRAEGSPDSFYDEFLPATDSLASVLAAHGK